MELLYQLSKKDRKLVVGLMSGTSVDGMDAVLVDIEGSGISTKIRQIDFITEPFPAGFKEFVLKNSAVGASDVADIARLNFSISFFYVDAIKHLCDHAGFALSDIDLIGSHGQTIHHLPEAIDFFGRKVAATLQIGDPSVIAKLTGVTTVGDFRTGDVALGGQGAPLVPYFDYLMFRSKKSTRALLNIGGIANITYLPKDCSQGEVSGFDTGPGNMLIDQMMKRYFGSDYDQDGAVAMSGNVVGDMMDTLMQDEFVLRNPPKSTGRERYGSGFVSNFCKQFEKENPRNVVATVTEFTCASVHSNYINFLKSRGEITELFVSGGGANNKYIMDSLRRLFKSATVERAENIGISSDAKEAVCFAVLANETISGNSTSLPQVTGASKATILGKICLP